MSTIPSGSTPNRNELADQYRTQQAEKDEIKSRHETEVSELKKNYSHEKASLEDRFEQSIQDERLSHYDHLRNTKNQLQKEERMLEEKRREIVGGRESDLYKEQAKTEQDGRTRVNQLQQKYAAAEEYERNRALAAQEEVHTKHKQSAEGIINESNKNIGRLREQKETELVTQKETHAQAIDQIHGHYDGLRNQTENQYATEFKNFQERATADMDQRKLATLVTLQNYATRQNDPFYRMSRFDSTLHDAGDAYVLRVKVPEYERDQFKVQVSGQEIQLNGVRAHNEKAEVEPGRWLSTNSYQNVSERVPLDMPVDGRSMTVKADGDWVEYTLPKFGPNRRVSDQYKPNVNADAVRQDQSMEKELNFKNSLNKPTLPKA
jgi:HSP20 family molecular chaperone IbpA